MIDLKKIDLQIWELIMECAIHTNAYLVYAVRNMGINDLWNSSSIAYRVQISHSSLTAFHWRFSFLLHSTNSISNNNKGKLIDFGNNYRYLIFITFFSFFISIRYNEELFLKNSMNIKDNTLIIWNKFLEPLLFWWVKLGKCWKHASIEIKSSSRQLADKKKRLRRAANSFNWYFCYGLL